MRVLCRNLIVLHFQRETLTKHHNRAEDSGLNRSPILQCSSIADLSFVACCAIQLLPILSIPSWLWIWAGIIVIIKIVNQISSLIIIKKFCFPHTIANKLTGFLLFLTVPTISWHIIPIAIVALIATFAALQEWHSIRNKIDIV